MRNTSFCQSNWHGFIWCMRKCYALQDTRIWWCLWNIILYNSIISLAYLFAIIVPTCWHSCQYVSLMAYGIANLFYVGCDRCYCHCSSWKPLGCYTGICFLPLWLIMATLWDGSWCSNCGRWNSHFMWMADVISNVADGIATCMVADVSANCGRWNSHFLRWLMLLPLWQME